MSISENDGKRLADAFERIAVAAENIAESYGSMASHHLTDEELEMNRLHAEIEKKRLENYIANGYKDPEPKKTPVQKEVDDLEIELRRVQLRNFTEREIIDAIEHRKWYNEHGKKIEAENTQAEINELAPVADSLENEGLIFEEL
jgi:hypothetical protein